MEAELEKSLQLNKVESRQTMEVLLGKLSMVECERAVLEQRTILRTLKWRHDIPMWYTEHLFGLVQKREWWYEMECIISN